MSLRLSLSMMVVDDMTVSRCLVEQALDEIGIKKVQYENSGEVALRKLASNPVHLVLLDFNMPGMRPWFRRHGLDWQAFLDSGIDVETLRATGDALVEPVILQAEARAAMMPEASDGR